MYADSLDLAPEVIQERLRWAREQGHPLYPWPDMSVGEWRASLREIDRVTTHILAGDPPPALVLPPEVDARKMGVAAFTSGMGALLGYWIEVGKLAAPPRVSDLFSLHLRHGRERDRLLTDELHKAVELLAAVGIDPIVIKGAHTAHVYFPDPGTRPASDLDLVIALDEVGEASRALREGGYVETNRQGRPRKSDWVPPGASTTLRSLEVTGTIHLRWISTRPSIATSSAWPRCPSGLSMPRRLGAMCSEPPTVGQGVSAFGYWHSRSSQPRSRPTPPRGSTISPW